MSNVTVQIKILMKLIVEPFQQWIDSLQKLGKPALLGRLSMYELMLQWVWLVAIVIGLSQFNAHVDYFWLALLLIVCTVCIPIIWCLTKKIIHHEQRSQPSIKYQMLLMLTYSFYIAFLMMLMEADGFFAGMSFISGIIAVTLLMDRRVAWTFLCLQCLIVILFMIAPYWFGELPSLRRSLMTGLPEFTANHKLSEGQIFWRVNALLLGLPKSIVLVCTVSMMLDRLNQSDTFIRHKAEYDAMTEVRNRRSILDYARKYLYNTPHTGDMSVLLIDLDKFKRVNDEYGHTAGDKVLKLTAAFFTEQMGFEGEVGRYGGEEFVIFLPETGMKRAAEIGEKLRLALSELPMDIGLSQPIKMTASFGVTTLDAETIRLVQQGYQKVLHCRDRRYQFTLALNEVLRNVVDEADLALYRAKDQGRNCVVVAKMIRSHEREAFKVFQKTQL